MPSTSTWALIGAGAFAAAAGGYYLLSKTFRVSFPGSVTPGTTVDWSASGMMAGDAYDFAVPWTPNDLVGTADASGKASGTMDIPSTLASGDYQGVFTDESTRKFALVNFVVT